MVSSTEADFNLREMMLLSRNILHAVRSFSWIYATANELYDLDHKLIEFRQVDFLNQRLRQVNLVYPASIRDTAKNGTGCADNRHLNYFAKVIVMNVGDLLCNAKAGSQPMSRAGVGAAIVVRARESRVQGKGPQRVNVSQVER